MSDEELRILEKTDVDHWGAAISRLPVEELKELFNKLHAEVESVKRKLNIVSSIIPRCPCGEPGEPWCDAYAGAEAELHDARTAFNESPTRDNARRVMHAANVVGFPWRQHGRCFFPGCQNHSEWDYDLPLALCDGCERLIAGPMVINENRARPRKPWVRP